MSKVFVLTEPTQAFEAGPRVMNCPRDEGFPNYYRRLLKCRNCRFHYYKNGFDCCKVINND